MRRFVSSGAELLGSGFRWINGRKTKWGKAEKSWRRLGIPLPLPSQPKLLSEEFLGGNILRGIERKSKNE